MPRELGDERARYGRKSLRERLEDSIAWPSEHPFATGVIVIVVAGALLLASLRGRSASVADLAVGDCLFVPTAAARDDANPRPIGEEPVVLDVLLTGGAQQAACTASHGHEVSAIVTPASPTLPSLGPGEMPTVLDGPAMRALTAPLCEDAFEAYVGRPLDGSRYVTFPVVPGADGAAAWITGGRRTVCLVARADGQWMDHPARGSGE